MEEQLKKYIEFLKKELEMGKTRKADDSEKVGLIWDDYEGILVDTGYRIFSHHTDFEYRIYWSIDRKAYCFG